MLVAHVQLYKTLVSTYVKLRSKQGADIIGDALNVLRANRQNEFAERRHFTETGLIPREDCVLKPQVVAWLRRLDSELQVTTQIKNLSPKHSSMSMYERKSQNDDNTDDAVYCLFLYALRNAVLEDNMYGGLPPKIHMFGTNSTAEGCDVDPNDDYIDIGSHDTYVPNVGRPEEDEGEEDSPRRISEFGAVLGIESPSKLNRAFLGTNFNPEHTFDRRLFPGVSRRIGRSFNSQHQMRLCMNAVFRDMGVALPLNSPEWAQLVNFSKYMHLACCMFGPYRNKIFLIRLCSRLVDPPKVKSCLGGEAKGSTRRRAGVFVIIGAQFMKMGSEYPLRPKKRKAPGEVAKASAIAEPSAAQANLPPQASVDTVAAAAAAVTAAKIAFAAKTSAFSVSSSSSSKAISSSNNIDNIEFNDDANITTSTITATPVNNSSSKDIISSSSNSNNDNIEFNDDANITTSTITATPVNNSGNRSSNGAEAIGSQAAPRLNSSDVIDRKPVNHAGGGSIAVQIKEAKMSCIQGYVRHAGFGVVLQTVVSCFRVKFI